MLFRSDVPNMSVEVCPAPAHTRIGWYRSVNAIHHGFAIGSFVDELAHAARDHAARLEKKLPTFALDAHYLDEEALRARLDGHRRAIVHELVVRGDEDGSLELTPLDAEVLDLGAASLARLAADIRAARTDKGKHDALVPLAEQ